MSNEARQPDSVDAKTQTVVRRVTSWVVWLGVQFVLAFVLLEIVARVLNPMGISYYPETAWHMDRVMIKEEPIGYRARPNYRGRHFGATIEINSLGLRDREIPAEPAENEFRILVMGDSVPYGVGVEYEESIPHQLELIANEAHDGDRVYRTINMGIPSYNTEQELVQLEMLGDQLRPNLVTLLFANNDIEPKMWVFEKRSSLAANVAQRSYAASLLFVLKRNLQSASPAANKDPNERDDRIDWGAYSEEHPRWQAIDQSLTQINDDCTARGIEFVLLFTSKPGTHIRDMLDTVGAREGFPVVTIDRNANPEFRADPLKFQNSVVDAHPNVAGSRLFAEQLHAALIEQGMLD